MNAGHRLELRRCLGRFATGVTVVSCRGGKGPKGITANSFSSVSLDPPLVLWNIAKVSNSLEDFLDAEHFAINVLGADQLELSVHFAQPENGSFGVFGHRISEHGVPLLDGCVATFECRTHRIHDCGDHHIIIGEVERCSVGGDEPLVFYGGCYRGLGGG